MFKAFISEVIARGKSEEDKAYREKVNKIYEKHGQGPEKVWRVEGRKAGQIIVEFPEFESREAADAFIAKISADKGWQELQQERAEAGTIVEGTQEIFMLTDY